jgi:hypothetical protein
VHLSIFNVKWRELTSKQQREHNQNIIDFAKFLVWKRVYLLCQRQENALKLFGENALQSVRRSVAIRIDRSSRGRGCLNNTGGWRGRGMIRRNRICFAQLRVSFYNIRRGWILKGDDEFIWKGGSWFNNIKHLKITSWVFQTLEEAEDWCSKGCGLSPFIV